MMKTIKWIQVKTQFNFFILCVLLISSLQNGLAQSPEKSSEHSAGDPVPFSLKAGIAIIPVGSTIILEGVGPVTSETKWAAEVILPNGSHHSLVPQVKKAGHFLIEWSKTQTVGKYQFIIKVPEQKLEVTTEKQVVASGAYGAQVRSEVEKMMQLVEKISKLTESRLAKLPPSPARDDATLRLKKLNDAIALHKQHQQSAFSQIENFKHHEKEMPASFAALDRRLLTWHRSSQEQREKFAAQIAKSESDNVTCEQMERVTEGLNLLSAMFNLVAAPFDIVINFSKDMVSNALSSWATDNFDAQNITKELTKNSTAAGAVAQAKLLGKDVTGGAREESLKTIPGLLVDASVYLTQKLFGKYCERFEGPMSATIDAEFYEDGKKWWTYKLKIEGKLTLRYAKQASGSAVAVNGEFIGQATSFETKENALAVLFPKLAGSTIKLAKIIEPIAVPYDFRPDGEGKLAATFTMPNSFFIPVKGKLVETQKDLNGATASANLILDMQAARVDFDAAANVVYLMISPLTQGIPTYTSFQLPFKSAHFVMMRAMNGTSANIDIKKVGGKLVAERIFNNERGGAAAKAKYFMQLRICNPGC